MSDKNENGFARTQGSGNIPLKKEIPKLFYEYNETNFNEWKDAIEDHLPNTLAGAIFCLPVFLQLLIKDIENPFSVILVDVASSSKTTTLGLFEELENLIYTTDGFTPASFVTHLSPTGAKKLNPEDLRKELMKIDLLPKIVNKVLIIREMATVFSSKGDKLKENLGTLTRVLDGDGLETDSGTHGKRGYSGDCCFMLLGASTPIRKSVWEKMGSNGARLFFFNTRQTDPTPDELVEQISGDSIKTKKKLCKEKTKNLVCSIWNKYPGGIEWDKSQDDPALLEFIGLTAMLLAKARGWVKKNDKGDITDSSSEKPFRLNQLIYNYARGCALMYGRTVLKAEDVHQALYLAVESAFPDRAAILKCILEKDDMATFADFERATGKSTQTVSRTYDELEHLELIEKKPKQIESVTTANLIGLTHQFKPLIGLCESVRTKGCPVFQKELPPLCF